MGMLQPEFAVLKAGIQVAKLHDLCVLTAGTDDFPKAARKLEDALYELAEAVAFYEAWKLEEARNRN